MSTIEPRGYSVLIADDDEGHRELVSRCLEKAGYTVAAARDGDEALRRLDVEFFDLVLLDYMMPRVNGLQVIETMTRADRTRDIPIIVMTAVGDRQTLAQCIDAGACDYITKPVEMAVVKTRVGQLLESRRYDARHRTSASDTEPVGGTILIVEDDEFNQDILARRVVQWGCRTATARDGNEAIRLLSAPEAACDLVMLDISMPGKDGFDVLAFIRSGEHLRHVPVIMVSAMSDIKTVLKALKNGASDFVTKPFNAVELRVRVHNALRLKKMRDRYARQEPFAAPGSPLDALMIRRKP